MAKINSARTFANKPFSTEEFVKNIVNLPSGVTNLIDSSSGKIHSSIIPSSEMDSLMWSGTNTYANKDLVYFEGRFYVSLKNNNLGNQPDISVTWAEYTVAVVRIATAETLGQVIVDGNHGISIDSNGLLSLDLATALNTADTTSVSFALDNQDRLTASVVISPTSGNELTQSNNGLYVEQKVFIVQTNDASTAVSGRLYYEKSTGKFCYFDGTNFQVLNNNVVSGTATQNTITLTLKDNSTVSIDCKALVKTANTDSLELSNNNGTISGNVKLDSQVDNQLRITPGGGLYVPSFGDASALFCYKKEFTRLDDETITWSGETMTVAHNMGTMNLLSLQIRHETVNGYKFYNNFSPYIIDDNTFQINVPTAFDLSDGTWQIFAPMLLETHASSEESSESSSSEEL